MGEVEFDKHEYELCEVAMTVKELEQRLVALEREVKRLRNERLLGEKSAPDWRRAVKQFRGDEDVLAVLREAMKLREKERRAVRKKTAKSRRYSP
jgi:uncharacterized small protein (DUF1192 family)